MELVHPIHVAVTVRLVRSAAAAHGEGGIVEGAVGRSVLGLELPLLIISLEEVNHSFANMGHILNILVPWLNIIPLGVNSALALFLELLTLACRDISNGGRLWGRLPEDGLPVFVPGFVGNVPRALDGPEDAILHTPEGVRLRLDVPVDVSDFPDELIVEHRLICFLARVGLFLDHVAFVQVLESDRSLGSVSEASSLSTLVPRGIVLFLQFLECLKARRWIHMAVSM